MSQEKPTVSPAVSATVTLVVLAGLVALFSSLIGVLVVSLWRWVL